MPKGVPLTDDHTDQMRERIAQSASKLIFEQGFNETSLVQIAKVAGIGKSTVYDYFKSKDEIMLYLLDEPLSEVRKEAVEIQSGSGTTEEKIKRILRMHLGILLRDKAFIFKLFIESQRLPLTVQAKHEVKRRAYQELLITLVQQGINNGEFRVINPDIMVKSLLSILSSVVMTPHPHGTPEQMLDEALDLLFIGAVKK